jgi:hypothetical protein
MLASRAVQKHTRDHTPSRAIQMSQAQTLGLPQPENVPEANPPLQRYLGNSYVQAMTAMGGEIPQADAIPPIVQEALRSPGQLLDPATRAIMEPRFSADFSHVRIHTDTRAAESAHAVNALAYTVGHDVVFGANKYAPSSHKGRRLLAHELAHTIQQRNASGAPPSADPHGIFESSADAAGREVANGRDVSGDLPACGVGLSRAPASPDQIEMPGDYAFALDPRRRTWRRYALSEGQKDAARIRKSGKLSSADRQEVNAKLAFFEGEAKEVYLREIKPTLLDVEAAERREREGRLAYSTSTRQSVLDRMAAEQEERREREGRLAYYTSTRQAVLDRQAAKLREEVHNTPYGQIQPQWKARKEAFISVASSPDHRLTKEQLWWIWLSYWAERNEAARSSYGQIKYLPAEDRLAAQEMAEREEATAQAMFRVSVDVNNFLQAVEDAGKHVTFQRINEVAWERAGYRNAWLNATAMFGARGGLRSLPSGASVRPPTAPPAVSVRPPTVPSVASAPVKPTPPPTPAVTPSPSRPVAGFARNPEPPPTTAVTPPLSRPVAGFARKPEPPPPPAVTPPLSRPVAGFARKPEPPPPPGTAPQGPPVVTQMPPARVIPSSPSGQGVIGQRRDQPAIAMAGTGRPPPRPTPPPRSETVYEDIPTAVRPGAVRARPAQGEIGSTQAYVNRIRGDPEFRQAEVIRLRRRGVTSERARRFAEIHEREGDLTLAALWRLFAELLRRQ